MVQHHHLCDGDGMTLITVQDGAVVMRDGQVGTEQACCCGDEECTCEQLVYDDCPAEFTVTYDAEGSFDPDCDTTMTYTIAKAQLDPADPVTRGWQGGVVNFVSVTLFCQEGRWVLNISQDNFPFDCNAFASISLDLGSVCSCPVTGSYTVPAGQVPEGTTVSVS